MGASQDRRQPRSGAVDREAQVGGGAGVALGVLEFGLCESRARRWRPVDRLLASIDETFAHVVSELSVERRTRSRQVDGTFLIETVQELELQRLVLGICGGERRNSSRIRAMYRSVCWLRIVPRVT